VCGKNRESPSETYPCYKILILIMLVRGCKGFVNLNPTWFLLLSSTATSDFMTMLGITKIFVMPRTMTGFRLDSLDFDLFIVIVFIQKIIWFEIEMHKKKGKGR